MWLQQCNVSLRLFRKTMKKLNSKLDNDARRPKMQCPPPLQSANYLE